MTTAYLTPVQCPAIQDILDTYDARERQEIAEYGCSSGIAHQHIYYQQTWEYFQKFEDQIEDYFFDLLGDNWMYDLSRDDNSVRGLVNTIVWSFIESVCNNY